MNMEKYFENNQSELTEIYNYTDVGNNHNTNDTDLNAKIYEFTSNKSTTGAIWIILIIVVVLMYIYFNYN